MLFLSSQSRSIHVCAHTHRALDCKEKFEFDIIQIIARSMDIKFHHIISSNDTFSWPSSQ